MDLYDQEHIRNFFDEYAEKETLRWERSIVEKVKHYVHLHYLKKYIEKDDLILELGAGTGVFTKELAEFSKNLTVTDLSPVQLNHNEKNAEKGKFQDRIKDWKITDICDLSEFANDTFDKILCYGGPLSYVFEKKLKALSEMKRVLKPGGIALISVMNLWGTVNQYLTDIMLEISRDDNEKIIKTGNLHPTSFAPSKHYCHMFTLEELITDIENAGFENLEISASNCLSSLRANELEEIFKNKEKWNYFLELEIRACRSKGMIESGTHIIAAIRK